MQLWQGELGGGVWCMAGFENVLANQKKESELLHPPLAVNNTNVAIATLLSIPLHFSFKQKRMSTVVVGFCLFINVTGYIFLILTPTCCPCF